MDQVQFDFVVIGSGLAGLTFALEVSQLGRVAVLTKAEVTDSNTQWAQGGIAAAVSQDDSWKLHEEDTLVAGSGTNDSDAVRFLVQEASAAIDWLVNLGTRFDSHDAQLALGREGGHSRNRIVHHADKTGWEVERAIVQAVRNNPNIEVFDHTFVVNLLTHEGRCVGAHAVIEGEERAFLARAVMLATGGCGRMFQHTTNPRVATADGIGLGHRIGAEITEMEFMQFHPTTLFHPQLRSFLITEAVRGAGGTLRNHLGRRFMYDYDLRLELAPRDIVARAMDSEMKKHETWCLYLDTTHLSPELLKAEFPTIYDRLQTIDIEMEKDWIPVVPAQHYSCGGVVTDLDARTSIPGLYASGEVARTGVHGANRLASNSLLEAIVFSKSASKAVESESGPLPTKFEPSRYRSIPESEAIRLRRILQKQMTQGAGIVRTDKGLRETISIIDKLEHDYNSIHRAPFGRYSLETLNLIQAARYVATGALERRENIGLHYNLDIIDPSSASRK